MKDFTREHKRIQFKIDDDVFEAAPALPARTLMEFAVTAERIINAEAEERAGLFDEMFGMILLPDSFELFQKRMADPQQPIEFPQIEAIIMWLFEEYGLRPTEVSFPSSVGSVDQGDGRSLTDNAHLAELTLPNSPSTASST